MSTHDDDDEDPCPSLPESFVNFIREAVREVQQESAKKRERTIMETDAGIHEMWSLLDSLTPRQLVSLRWILHLGSDMTPSALFIDGQIVSILRTVHGVDPETGLTVLEQFTQR